MAKTIPVIMCGGSGSRLWPVSREGFPKPFVTLPDGGSLIKKTIARARLVAPDSPIVFVCGESHGFLIEQALKSMGDEGEYELLLEPVARNTAPAIALAALRVNQRYDESATLLVLAADHLIADQAGFEVSVKQAEAAALSGALVTFGIVPTAPETGYGYLEQGENQGINTFKVQRFVEKPNAVKAAEYLASGHYAWNSGMFCFRVDGFLKALSECSPALAAASQTCFQATEFHHKKTLLDKASFSKCESISVDYAVMEKAKNVQMVKASFDWNDIGAWPALADTLDADTEGNKVYNREQLSHTQFIRAKSNFVLSDKTVAAIGVENLLIVDTKDALLVAHANDAQSVKSVVDQLNKSASPLAKLHTTVYRPWGTYTILEDETDCKVKRLVVYPGASISLQLHHKRSEHWVVVAGTATVTLGKEVLTLHNGQSVFIPVGTVHRLENKTNEPVAIIETQVGGYFGEDDIVRLEDIYGRVVK